VLNTQADNAANIKAFSRNLAAFTTQLRDSNGDLTGSLDQAPGAISQLNDLIGQLQPTVPLLLDNLTSIGEVTKVYAPNIQQSLVILPADINDLISAIDSSTVPDSSNVNFKMEANPTCTSGYSSTMRQPDNTSSKAAPAKTPYCTASQSSQLDARGARNDPCPNNPSIRSATAAGCGLEFGTSGVPAGGSGSGNTSAATYDPSNGLLVGPNGLLYSVGSQTISGNGPTTLSGLLKETLGS
jgi:phospholipid/cholesterol/gamma-HCH transport system substrate-binding protein